MGDEQVRITGQTEPASEHHVQGPVRPLAEAVKDAVVQIHVDHNSYWPYEPPMLITRAERAWIDSIRRKT
jgi:hypothetical protein